MYKVEPYLWECLDSIAASSLQCWETILIDDGSPDGCPQICDGYAAQDKRFRVIHQQNAGVAVARNAGLDVAQGEWIWFVDSDDVVDLTPMSEMVEWLNRNRNVDLVMFNLSTFQDGENPKEDVQASMPCSAEGRLQLKERMNVHCEESKNDFLMEHVCFHHQRLWYKKDLLDKNTIRFTKGVRLAEDLELQYKYLTMCQNPVKLDTVLYYYRVREGSATQNSTYRIKAVEDLKIVIDNLAEWIRKHEILSEPWLDLRIMKLFQNMLYSASLIPNLNTEIFKDTVRNIVFTYLRMGFPFTKKCKYKLAVSSINSFFILNRLYLKLIKRQS